MLTLRPRVQVCSSGQELSGGQRTGHRLLRLTQGKKGEVLNTKSEFRQATDKTLGIFSLTRIMIKYMALKTGNSCSLHHMLQCTIWPQHVLCLVPPISGQVTGTCDQEHRQEGEV